MAYARDIGAPFAYSSNGHGIVEFDSLTLTTRDLDAFPTSDELAQRLAAGATWRGPHVTNRHGDLVANPALQPSGHERRLRYYQERAVAAAIDELLRGRHRTLLSLATGTGKTVIAYNVALKLLRSRYARRVLFLADRVGLRDQAYNSFSALGNERGVIDGPDLPLQRSVHFGIYQGLFAVAPDGRRVFEQYPADYFDLIIIDECHRSGYGDWAEILDYFADAFHLGLTATPKRTDSIDTYETFAGENRDANGEPVPAFEYSLGQGLEDGFLATYRVHKIETNVDANGLHIGEEVARGAELIVPEDATVRDAYAQSQFEREIVLPDRTRVMCEHLATMLRRFGANDKTIVFCVTAEHAERVRTHLQAMLGPDTGKAMYAARIVGEERDAHALLAEFQLSSSSEPVVATTVDLLTTGIDAPSVRNIVFMKPVASSTVFKQIIGRGTRLDPSTGKEFFRIIDYTNASRLIDAWDLPVPPPVGGPDDGDGIVSGTVTSSADGTALAGALVTARLGPRPLAEVVAAKDGTYALVSLPRRELVITATQPAYTRSDRTADLLHGDAHLDFALRAAGGGVDRIVINGVTVNIVEETDLVLKDGSQLTVVEYIERAGAFVAQAASDSDALTAIWCDAPARSQLVANLATDGVTAELLGLVLGRPDADGYDLLAHAAFDARILSREDRVRAVESTYTTWKTAYTPEQLDVVDALLDAYLVGGVEEISSSEAFRSAQISALGGVRHVVQVFGGADAAGQLLRDVQRLIYSKGSSA
nr:DEAD/DEAH box helicase family protein [Cellulomonas sp. JH27-2]